MRADGIAYLLCYSYSAPALHLPQSKYSISICQRMNEWIRESKVEMNKYNCSQTFAEQLAEDRGFFKLTVYFEIISKLQNSYKNITKEFFICHIIQIPPIYTILAFHHSHYFFWTRSVKHGMLLYFLIFWCIISKDKDISIDNCGVQLSNSIKFKVIHYCLLF